jgi:hypothetical protein
VPEMIDACGNIKGSQHQPGPALICSKFSTHKAQGIQLKLLRKMISTIDSYL